MVGKEQRNPEEPITEEIPQITEGADGNVLATFRRGQIVFGPKDQVKIVDADAPTEIIPRIEEPHTEPFRKI